jgi:hypothetical protein
VTVGYKRYQARRGVYAGCGALAAAVVIWSGTNLYSAGMLRGDTDDAARRTAELSSRYLEITRQFPQAPTNADNLKKAVEIGQRLRETTRSPQKMIALVSRALETSPAIVVREFGWKYGTTEIETGVARTVAVAGPAPETQATGAAPAPSRKESALIDGEVRPFRGDYRSAINSINSFAGRLAGQPGVAEVRVVKLPLNVDPALSLSGNTLDNPEQINSTADFKLLLVLKPGT